VHVTEQVWELTAAEQGYAIEEITTRGIEYPAPPLMKSQWGDTEYACLVSVRVGGCWGHAFSRCPMGIHPIVNAVWIDQFMAKRLVGRPLAEYPRHWARFVDSTYHQRLHIFPVSAVDVAIWDARGKLAGQPVAALLNPDYKRSVRAYASIPGFREGAPAAEESLKTVEAGFGGIKTHTVNDIGEDMDVLGAISNAVGDRAHVMYDASTTLTDEKAATIGRFLGDIGAHWFEEPFPVWHAERYRRLRSAADVPLTGFETAPGAPGSIDWALETKVFDFIEIDANWKAGVTGAYESMSKVTSGGVQIAMHHAGASSMNIANIHLVSAWPAVDMIELLTPADKYNVASVLPKPDPATGTLAVPAAPGLGEDIDWEFVNAHEVTL
jgi:L-alanine-DL-glutamate epimerase-like enolase superfamily enzyme